MDTNPPTSRQSQLTLKALLLNGMQALCLICWLAQCVIDSSTDNLLPVTLIVASTSLVLQYLRLSAAMTTQPLTAFTLLGFTSSSQFVALVFQTFDWVPMVQYLRSPMLTFGVLAIVHVTVVLAHFVYRNFAPLANIPKVIAVKVLSPLKIHSIPTPMTVWLMSALGVLAAVMGGGSFGDAGGKFLAGFSFLLWVPYLIPIYAKIVGPSYCDMKKQYTMLALYTLVIVAIALSRNIRSMLLIGPIQLTFLFVLESCRTAEPVSRRTLKALAVGAITAAIAIPAMSDLAIAMEIAREKRDTSTAAEVAKETADIFFDKTRISQYRAASRGTYINLTYDETYLSNPLFARFTETKFHDNMIYFGSLFSEEDRLRLIDNQTDKVKAILPQNVYDALGIKFNKNDFVFSTGDYYRYIDHGGAFGGFATGSIWADMYVVFGVWFPFVLFVLITVVFVLMDANGRFDAGHFICPAALCALWPLYLYGIGGESISFKVNQITRGTLQPWVLYALVVLSIYAMLQLFRREAFVSVGTPAPDTKTQPATP